jgi:hypothetical protein
MQENSALMDLTHNRQDYDDEEFESVTAPQETDPVPDDAAGFNQDEEGNDLGGLMSMIAKGKGKKGGKGKKAKKVYDDEEEDAAEILARLEAEAEAAAADDAVPSASKGKKTGPVSFATLGDEGDALPDDQDDPEPEITTKKSKEPKGNGKKKGKDATEGIH